MNKKKLQIGVLGWAGSEEYPSGGPTRKELDMAQEVGYLLAKKGTAVVAGGKGGIMESAAKGAKEIKNSITIGVITGPRGTSNQWIDVEIITGAKISGWDEVLLPLMCDAVIIIGGGVGTLQEICVSYRNKIPIIIMEESFGWASKVLAEKYLDSRKTTPILSAQSPKEAVDKAIKQAYGK